MKKLWFLLPSEILTLLVIAIGAIGSAALTFYALENQPALAQELTPNTESSTKGLVVSCVDPGSPAEKAGVKRGDILLQIGGQEVNSSMDLMKSIRNLKAGNPLELKLTHGDEERKLQVTPEERDGLIYLGLQTCDCGKDTIVMFSITQKAEVIEVLPDSPAEKSGLKTGDTILAVNGTPVDPFHTLCQLIQQHKPGDQITLKVQREAQGEIEIQVTLGKNPDDASKPYLGVKYAPHAGTIQMGKGFAQSFEGRLPLAPEFHFEFPPDDLLSRLPEGTFQGVIVKEVINDSPADTAGLKDGDLISEIDGEKVESPDSLVNTIKSHQPGDSVTLTVLRFREKDPLSISVVLGNNPQNHSQAFLGVKVFGMISVQIDRNGDPEVQPELPEDSRLPDNKLLFFHIDDWECRGLYAG